MKNLIILLFLSNFMGISCSNDHTETEPKDKGQRVEASQASIKQQFMQANRQLMQKENDEMDYYEKTHKMGFVRTPSGVRYFVYKHSDKGDSIKTGMLVTIDYTVRLLDGTECYSSKTSGPKTFEVGHENIESGIHIGVTYLKKGDKAIFLIPSPLAHGLLGDQNKIPPQMPLVYELEVQ